jgi:hypothetical protein
MSCTPSFRLPMSLVSGIKFAIMRDADTLLLGEVSSGRCAQRAALMLPPPNKMGGKSLKMYLLHCIGAFLTLLAAPAHAAVGFLVNGVCALDQSTALAAFSTNYPMVTATTITTFSDPVYLPQSGQVLGNLVVSDRVTGFVSSTWHVFQLTPCTTPVSQLGDFPIQDVVFVFACVIIWAFGFQSGMHR